jgi:signal peptidase II
LASSWATPEVRVGALAALLIVAADQLSKQILHDYLVVQGHGHVELTPFANLVAVWNYGVSFGMFNSGSTAGAWIFVTLAVAIVAILIRWLIRNDRPLVALSLGLVIGGAIGNVIDRLRFGAVFDFLDVHAYGWHWPAFNLADAGITVGVAGLFVDALFDGSRRGK